jgi:hypothetical protein
MSNIELRIPASLIAAWIRRANSSINEETAREDAAVVHDIIARVQEAYAIRPTGWIGQESDAIETILCTAVGAWLEDKSSAPSEGEWVALLLWDVEQVTGESGLYRKLLRVYGHVDNFDYESRYLNDDMTRTFHALMEGVTFEDEVVLEDDDDIDGDRTRRPHRRRSHLHLVAEPELISADDMTRWFHQLMGESS